MNAWPTLLAALTAIATAATRIVEFFQRKQEREAAQVDPPKRPSTVDKYLKRKHSPSGGSASQ